MKHTLVLAGALALAIVPIVASSPSSATSWRPRDVVRIVEGTPYEVPLGRLLELKAVSATGFAGGLVALEVDGQAVANVGSAAPAGGGASGVQALPQGLLFRPGEVVSLTPLSQGATDQVVLFGFLSSC